MNALLQHSAVQYSAVAVADAINQLHCTTYDFCITHTNGSVDNVIIDAVYD
jgi:hypothetical protein